MQENVNKQETEKKKKHESKERNSEKKGKKPRQKETEIQVLITSCHKVVFLLLNTYLELENQVVKLQVENVDASTHYHDFNSRRE